MISLFGRHKTAASDDVQERGSSRVMLLTALVVALLVAVVAGGVGFSMANKNKTDDSNKSVNSSEYQALFLTNGQVYFGKLSDLGNKYVTMTDIYYLQVQQTADSQQSVQPAGSGSANSQVSLAKLGSELHGPEDKMSVSSQQVLFWENLKNNSKVVEAIKKYQNK